MHDIPSRLAPPPAPRGRFAPFPTGPLHFGSLLTALGSYLQARAQRGEWLVRIEDIDPPREQPGAADAILRALEAYGLEWDGSVVYQSHRQEAYDEALARLKDSGHLYPCGCSRQDIAQNLPPGAALVYPGTCRNGTRGRKTLAFRVRTPASEVGFDDALQGRYTQSLARDVGDFVLQRADGLYAYQLAVVVDDAAQGISEVVRGADLLDNTPRQIHLQSLLGLPTPRYAHLPVAVGANGEKLSKQNLAPPLDLRNPGPTLWRALTFLGQAPPTDLQHAPARPLLDWAVAHWDLASLPRRRTLAIDAIPG